MAKPTKQDARAFAKEHLGIDALRPGQEEAIMAVLRGRDTLAIMPTGSGKSAIYQVAGGLLGGLTLVISPLIALQRDQVESLDASEAGVAAELNSALGATRHAEVLDAVRAGAIRYLFLAPEQLQNDETVAALGGANTKLIVIDEAHCISEWGHDFRPDYLHLGAKIAELGHPTILGLTATAAPRVQGEIVERLGMERPKLVVQDFDRPNIHLAVRHFRDDDDKRAAMLEAIAGAETPGIIYAARRRDTETIAEELRDRSIPARAYHAGLKASEREEIQDAFMTDDLDVIVATIAFGMGIDKPNVRFVWHYDISASLDSYYQEIGRAGRDGDPADALLFYVPENLDLRRFQSGAGQVVQDEVEQVIRELGQADGPVDPSKLEARESLTDTALTRILDRLADVEAIELNAEGIVEAASPDGDPTQIAAEAVAAQGELRQYEMSRLEMMRQYADLETCRRAFLLRYFDQRAPDRCDACDNCETGRTEAATVADQRFPDNAQVTHAEWGDGTVIKNDGDTVTVHFDSVGYKTLSVDLVEQQGLLVLKDSGIAAAT